MEAEIKRKEGEKEFVKVTVVRSGVPLIHDWITKTTEGRQGLLFNKHQPEQVEQTSPFISNDHQK